MSRTEQRIRFTLIRYDPPGTGLSDRDGLPNTDLPVRRAGRAGLDHGADLVMHRRDDRAIPFALGRDMASRIPGAAFLGLDGTDHVPWRGDAESVVNAMVGFLSDESPPPPIANIRAKLGLTSRTAAAAHAVKAGLVD